MVRELERLEHAVAALARAGARSVPGRRSRVAAPRTAPRAKRAAPRKGEAGSSTATPKAGRVAQKRRTPAPRGQTRAKVREALAAAPCSSSAAVAQAAGISPSAEDDHDVVWAA
jgi:hypothetical protein